MLPRGPGRGQGLGRGRGGWASLLHVEYEEYEAVEVVVVKGKLLSFEKLTVMTMMSLCDTEIKIRQMV